MQSPAKSIFTYAAESGVTAGLLLCLMALCLFLSMQAPWLSTVMLLLGAGLLAFVARGMRRIYVREESYRKVAALWLYGIYTIIFGTLIAALFSTVWLMFVNPGFIPDYIRWAAEHLPSSSLDPGQRDLISKAVDANIYPSSGTFVSTMMWFMASSGSILSFPFAFITMKYYTNRQKKLGDSINN